MIEILLCIPLVYFVGWIICAFIMANYWIGREMYPNTFDYIEGGVWGLLGGFIWPVLLVGLAIGKLVKRNRER